MNNSMPTMLIRKSANPKLKEPLVAMHDYAELKKMYEELLAYSEQANNAIDQALSIIDDSERVDDNNAIGVSYNRNDGFKVNLFPKISLKDSKIFAHIDPDTKTFHAGIKFGK